MLSNLKCDYKIQWQKILTQKVNKRHRLWTEMKTKVLLSENAIKFRKASAELNKTYALEIPYWQIIVSFIVNLLPTALALVFCSYYGIIFVFVVTFVLIPKLFPDNVDSKGKVVSLLLMNIMNGMISIVILIKAWYWKK